MPSIQKILRLFAMNGHSQYGGEAVSQLEHALQAACFAEEMNSSPALISAALLHDIGHLLHTLPNDAPDQGVDDHHENSGHHYLTQCFSKDVTEPIRLHVAAKRYLCSIDPDYQNKLSQPSIVSMNLQGGLMTAAEVRDFAAHPFCEFAVQLRRWDDAAKIPNHPTPTLDHFSQYLRATHNGDIE